MKEDFKKQFVQIIQSHQGIINSICRVYFPKPANQKDIRQEIILQLWKAYPNFRGEAKVSTWIYKVALNTVLYQLRKRNKIPTKVAISSLVDLQIPIAIIDDDVQQLQQLISLLKAEDKALVILYLEGYTHKEIAATLETTATNVSTRLNRIKKRLQSLYKKYTHEVK